MINEHRREAIEKAAAALRLSVLEVCHALNVDPDTFTEFQPFEEQVDALKEHMRLLAEQLRSHKLVRFTHITGPEHSRKRRGKFEPVPGSRQWQYSRPARKPS